MNWTGGKLQRSKNANRGVIPKQKAHFARVRTQVEDTAFSSPQAFDSSMVCGDAPFSSHALHHTGHSGTPRDHGHGMGISPVVRNRPKTHHEAESRPMHGQTNGAASEGGNNRYHRDGEKRPALDDPDGDPLETKRRTLLQQSDWAGLTHQKRSAMHSKAQDREMIGKRHALTVRKGHLKPVPRPLQTQTSWYPGRDTGGAHQKHDIRIRIGTDALTSATPMQTSQLQAAVTSYDSSPESMLDNGDLHITPRPGQQGHQTPRGFVGAYGPGSRPPAQEPSLRSQQRYRKGGSVTGARCRQSEDGNASPAVPSQNKSSNRLPTVKIVSSEERCQTLGRRITHPEEGLARPLRLTLEAASKLPIAPGPVMNESRKIMIGETIRDHDATNVTGAKSGNVNVDIKSGHPESRRSQVIDDSCWRVFLPAWTDSSSLSLPLARNASATDGVHDRPARVRLTSNAESAPWSHRATEGDRTLVDSTTCVSPSLASANGNGNEDGLRDWPQMRRVKLGRRPRTQMIEDEGCWRKLVFGSDPGGPSDNFSEIPKGHMRGANRGMHAQYDTSNADGPCRSPFGATLQLGESKGTTKSIASSVEAVALSSTSFDRLLGPGTCVSDSAQYATTRAPLAMSSASLRVMPPSSPVPLKRRSRGRYSSMESSGDTILPQADDGGLGLQSVSHSSMQNNASYSSDASWSRISGDTARALHMEVGGLEGCENRPSGSAQASRGTPTSVRDMAVSEDEESGLDVVV